MAFKSFCVVLSVVLFALDVFGVRHSLLVVLRELPGLGRKSAEGVICMSGCEWMDGWSHSVCNYFFPHGKCWLRPRPRLRPKMNGCMGLWSVFTRLVGGTGFDHSLLGRDGRCFVCVMYIHTLGLCACYVVLVGGIFAIIRMGHLVFGGCDWNEVDIAIYVCLCVLCLRRAITL